MLLEPPTKLLQFFGCCGWLQNHQLIGGFYIPLFIEFQWVSTILLVVDFATIHSMMLFFCWDTMEVSLWAHKNPESSSEHSRFEYPDIDQPRGRLLKIILKETSPIFPIRKKGCFTDNYPQFTTDLQYLRICKMFFFCILLFGGVLYTMNIHEHPWTTCIQTSAALPCASPSWWLAAVLSRTPQKRQRGTW